jgi:hypothetical protein
MISTPVSHADLWSLNPLDKRQSKPNTRFEQLPFLSSKMLWLFIHRFVPRTQFGDRVQRLRQAICLVCFTAESYAKRWCLNMTMFTLKIRKGKFYLLMCPIRGVTTFLRLGLVDMLCVRKTTMRSDCQGQVLQHCGFSTSGQKRGPYKRSFMTSWGLLTSPPFQGHSSQPNLRFVPVCAVAIAIKSSIHTVSIKTLQHRERCRADRSSSHPAS